MGPNFTIKSNRLGSSFCSNLGTSPACLITCGIDSNANTLATGSLSEDSKLVVEFSKIHDMSLGQSNESSRDSVESLVPSGITLIRTNLHLSIFPIIQNYYFSKLGWPKIIGYPPFPFKTLKPKFAVMPLAMAGTFAGANCPNDITLL
jgi:hypothetical protein